MDDWCVLPSSMQTSAALHSFRVRARRTTLSHAGRPVHMDWHVTGRVTAVCVSATAYRPRSEAQTRPS
jgi:hypothetical protein